MRILITGASGFIGRHLVDRLAGDHEIWAMAGAAVPEIASQSGVHWFDHDLMGPGSPDVLPDEIDAVVHLAQSRRFREYPDYADEILAVNVSGTVKILEWARTRGAARFIYVSTGGVSGPSTAPIGETDPFNVSGPLTFYLTSKCCAEMAVKSYVSFFPPVIVRPFFVYGPGQRADMLIPRLIGRIREGQPVTLRPPDGLTINPVHVGDAVVALERALAIDEAATINLAGPEAMTIREISETLGALLGIEPVFEIETSTGVPTGDLVADITEMTRRLGQPTIRFRDGAGPLCT